MATPIIHPVPSSPAIKRDEEASNYDEYCGSVADLIAAGLVRADQFPSQGATGVSYLGGQIVKGRCKMDETWFRVGYYSDGSAYVRVGVAAVVSQRRKATARAARQAKDAALRAQYVVEERARLQDKRAEDATRARRDLEQIPACEDDYRRHVVRQLRRWMRIEMDIQGRESDWHGFMLDRESVEAVLIAGDALVEAVMQAAVHFDAALHARIVEDYQATIRAADPSFYAQFDKLVAPNPSLLEGEAS